MDSKTCSKCGDTKPAEDYYRRSSGRLWGYCIACAKAQRAEHRDAHRDAKRARDRKYREENRDDVNRRKREQYAADPTSANERARRYYRSNRRAVRAVQQRYRDENRDALTLRQREAYAADHVGSLQRSAQRRARRKQAPGSYSARDVVRKWHSQRGECFWCGVKCGKSPDDRSAYHVDHVTALVRGGTNHPRNICIACPTCNLRKRDAYPSVFKARMHRKVN